MITKKDVMQMSDEPIGIEFKTQEEREEFMRELDAAVKADRARRRAAAEALEKVKKAA